MSLRFFAGLGILLFWTSCLAWSSFVISQEKPELSMHSLPVFQSMLGKCVTCIVHSIPSGHHVQNASLAVEAREVSLQDSHLPPPRQKRNVGYKGGCELP